MKRIILSSLIIVFVSAMVIGGTTAFFNDTEKSQGNIFVTGDIDLKVDHVWQTYNDVDCKTCSVVLISDPTNIVVEKNGSSVTPYPAVFVGSNGGFIHSAWTAEEDPSLDAAGAEWIWEADPTSQADVVNNVTYTFRKTFQWFGPITASDLSMAVGHDNTVEVWLNGVKIGDGTDSQGYKLDHMLHIPANIITTNILQGNNVIEFVVTNEGQSNGTPTRNPAGLVYKFEIDGNCGDEYFRTHCDLWGEKDLDGETFFSFDDIKPGDQGSNVISLHVYSNDAWSCMYVEDVVDLENDLVEPEADAGDVTAGVEEGELSDNIEIMLWNDNNHNGIYEPQLGETIIAEDAFTGAHTIADSLNGTPLVNSETSYVGLAWCVGEQTINNDGSIDCDGSNVDDKSQTDSVEASLRFYVEQVRNNDNFVCHEVKTLDI